MTDATEIVAEAAEAVASEATQVAQASRALSSRDVKIALLAAGMGLLAGAAVSHFITKRREQAKADAYIDDQVQEMDRHYRARAATEGKPDLDTIAARYESPETAPTPEQVAEAVLEHPEVQAGLGVNGADPTKKDVEYHNVFEHPNRETFVEEAKASEQWDYATEVKLRTPEHPYIIHKDEVGEMVTEKDYADVTFTFFEGDGILMGERDEVIDNQEDLVGLENLDRFGHGSGDPDVVYIRNDKFQMEIRVQRSGGSYSEEVHGFPDDEPGVRQSRRFDDDDGSP